MTTSAAAGIRQIARAAGTVMLAYVISTITGLARQMLVAGAFGTGPEMEAFSAANRVSETLFLLVAGGALASAFIPTFTGLLARSDRDRAWRLASVVLNWVVLIMAATTLLAAWLAPQIVRYILAPGFSADPAKEALTIALTRLMLPSAVIFSISGLLMGVLNAHQVFLAPALAPGMYQLGLIFGATVLAPRLGIFGLGWGVLIGAGLYLGLQIPSLIRLRGKYSLTLGKDDPAFTEVTRLLAPRLLGVAVVQLNFWINTRLASLQMEGSVAAIVIAFSLMLMPQAAIAQAVATAAMPTLSEQFALGRLDQVRASLSASLRGVLFLSIPASLGLVLLRQPIIVLLFQRDQFDARSTTLVAWALLWYAAGLVGHCLVEILARAFYALHDTRTPVFIGASAMLLNVIFSYALSEVFARIGWMPHGGLALANTLATTLEAAGLWIWMHRRLAGLEGRQLLLATGKGAVATAAMGVFLAGWLWLTAGHSAWLSGGGGVLLGALVYGLALLATGASEPRRLLRLVADRLRASRSSGHD